MHAQSPTVASVKASTENGMRCEGGKVDGSEASLDEASGWADVTLRAVSPSPAAGGVREARVEDRTENGFGYECEMGEAVERDKSQTRCQDSVGVESAGEGQCEAYGLESSREKNKEVLVSVDDAGADVVADQANESGENAKGCSAPVRSVGIEAGHQDVVDDMLAFIDSLDAFDTCGSATCGLHPALKPA